MFRKLVVVVSLVLGAALAGAAVEMAVVPRPVRLVVINTAVVPVTYEIEALELYRGTSLLLKLSVKVVVGPGEVGFHGPFMLKGTPDRLVVSGMKRTKLLTSKFVAEFPIQLGQAVEHPRESLRVRLAPEPPKDFIEHVEKQIVARALALASDLKRQRALFPVLDTALQKAIGLFRTYTPDGLIKGAEILARSMKELPEGHIEFAVWKVILGVAVKVAYEVTVIAACMDGCDRWYEAGTTEYWNCVGACREALSCLLRI